MSNFTNSPLISLTNLSPFNNSPRNQPIRKITIHHFAGNATIEAVSNFLRQPGRNASYNYGIGSDGRVVLIVNERDRCWGSSSGDNDHQAVVIGVANNTGGPTWGISDAAFETLLNLVRCICTRNNIRQITYDGTRSGTLTRHNFFAATLCPGPTLQARFPEIAETMNRLLGANTTTPRPSVYTFSIGEVVQFTGGGVFTSSTAAAPAHSRGPSRCRVTSIATGRRNPLHLVSEDGGRVHGWVMAADVRPIPPALPPAPVRTPEEIMIDNAIAAGLITDRAHWLGVVTGNVKPVAANVRRMMQNALDAIDAAASR